MSLPVSIASRLRLPLMAAPMLHVSGPDLVSAACRAGIIGSFPTPNARTADQLDQWLMKIEDDCARSEGPCAPVCANIIMRSRSDLLQADLEVLVKHRVPMVLASVGSPESIIGPLHDVGCVVLADVASLRHAEKALEAGVDGLVLLSAGAGGHTGWANGISFVRAVRSMWAGLLVLAGGISDGAALWAARVMGCDVGLMGTRLIATGESMAVHDYKAMLVDSKLDDVALTRGVSGLDANFLRPSLLACGLDPEELAKPVSPERARELFSAYAAELRGPKRWVDLWSAGHTVSAVEDVLPVAELVDAIAGEYLAAQRETLALLDEESILRGAR
ncbi:MAG: nitronate monooxygenase [Burkholderiaceae bacterium]|nr:nitronate monooxygenase [Burkholderiaceae bacterium]